MVNIAGMKMFAEFLGTFILGATIQFATIYDQGSQSSLMFSVLAGFFIAITLTREISGGHINPGVTLSVYLAEKDPTEKTEQAARMWMYIVGQVGGAVCAAIMGSVLYNDNLFKLAPDPKTYSSEAFVLEVIGSALFYSTILVQGDKDAKLTNDKTISTLVITAGLAGGIALSGNVSGAGLNPALGFGFNFSRLLVTAKLEECKYLWVYILGPAVGAYAASYFYNEIFKRFFEEEYEEEKKMNLLENNDNLKF